jgi:hypothetical protein
MYYVSVGSEWDDYIFQRWPQYHLLPTCYSRNLPFPYKGAESNSPSIESRQACDYSYE